jgi:hypothetical protein
MTCTLGDGQPRRPVDLGRHRATATNRRRLAGPGLIQIVEHFVSQAVACHDQLTHRDAELFQDVVEAARVGVLAHDSQ